MISFKTKITLEDFQDFNLSVYKQKWSFKMMQIVSILFIFMFLAMVYLSFQSEEKVDWSTFGILMFALIYLFGIPWFLKYNAKKTYFSNAILQEEILFEIDDNTIKTTATSYQSNFDWNQIYKITENDKAIFIYMSKQTANLLPKRDLTSEQLAEIKQIIRSKSGFSVKLLN